MTQKASHTSVFTLHTVATAPEGAAEVLDKVQQRYGFVPNLAAYLAEAPVALEGVMSLSALFDKTSLSAAEQQIVLLSASVANDCEYCKAAHSALARKVGIDALTIGDIVEQSALDNPRHAALRELTTELVQKRGRIDNSVIERFLGAGFSKANVFEVVLGVAMKTLTNYANHIASAVPNAEFIAAAS